MPISPARRIAYDILSRVESEGAYASDLLHAELGAGVSPADAALATELTFGVLRWRGLLDFLVQRHLKKPLDRMDPPVTIALRMGLYQFRFLQRIPARAAVNESVELVKRARKSSAAALVNAVLRQCAAEANHPAEEFLTSYAGEPERLAILQSHPAWLIKRWMGRWGEPKTIALLEANNRAPRLSCTPSEENNRGEVIAKLQRSKLGIEPGCMLRPAFAVASGSPSRSRAFREGLFSIQDEASQAVSLLLGAQPGDKILDLCAAPGGKTSSLARTAGDNGFVVAADRHAHRLRAMRAQFRRLGLRGVQLVELDASLTLPFSQKFDRILVDAPCSGTGTLARHPEIRWRLRPEQLTELHALQNSMLVQALAQLAPGGRLVYSTCSLEPEENEAVVDEALRKYPRVRRAPAGEIQRSLAPHLAPGVNADQLIDSLGHFRTFPGDLPVDGFFAAALELT
jgi:16S rRNA (cytosine967-C5)-methyltransferase